MVEDEEVNRLNRSKGEKQNKSNPTAGANPENIVSRDAEIDTEQVTVATDGGVVTDEDGENYTDWEEFTYSDEGFLERGDKVRFDRDDEEVTAEVKKVGAEDIIGVETKDGEDLDVTMGQVTEYKRRIDEKHQIRQRLREHFDGIEHSGALSDWTDDKKYREIQEQLTSGAETAKQSPMYDHDPDMATQTAILATTDEDSAERIRRIQSQAQKNLPEKMTVYRGIDVDEDEFMSEAKQTMENGDTISDVRFQAASIDEDVADGFGNITLEINTDHGVYVRAASEHAGEDEILLPAGTEYEVEDVDTDEGRVEVTAKGGFGFRVNADEMREKVQDGMSYREAVEEMI